MSVTYVRQRTANIPGRRVDLSPDEMTALARRVREAFISTGDEAVADAVLAEGFVYHGPAMLPELRGRAAFKEAIAGFRTALPELRETIME